MNTTPSTLDHFETALLGELREHVAARPGPATHTPESPVVRPHRRRRWAAGVAAAAAAATAYVIVSPGGSGVSPAYAVEEQSDGDVVVTIHRLEDAAGLEAALREHGIDAEVSFDPFSSDDQFTFQAPGETPRGPRVGGGSVERYEAEAEDQGPRLDQAQPPKDGQVPDVPDCGTANGEPATLTHEGDDWVLLIPADSPLQDRPVAITTGARGELGVAYEGNDPGSMCAVLSAAN